MTTKIESDDPAPVVVEILATELKTSAERVYRATSLKNELGMDSIAAANAAFALEDRYAIELQIGDDDTFDTVEDIVAIVRRSLRMAAPEK